MAHQSSLSLEDVWDLTFVGSSILFVCYIFVSNNLFITLIIWLSEIVNSPHPTINNIRTEMLTILDTCCMNLK